MSKSKKILSIVFTFVIFLLISMQSVNATMEEVPSLEGLESIEVQVDLINTKKPENIDDGIEEFLAVEPNIITFHYEACKDKDEVIKFINMIKEYHCKVGISVKPETDVEKIYEFLPFIHNVLIMTVEPGKGGQTLLPDMLEKIKRLREYIDKEDLEIDIEVDGGINLKTAPEVKKAGANILVAGTAILMAKDYKVIIDELKGF